METEASSNNHVSEDISGADALPVRIVVHRQVGIAHDSQPLRVARVTKRKLFEIVSNIITDESLIINDSNTSSLDIFPNYNSLINLEVYNNSLIQYIPSSMNNLTEITLSNTSVYKICSTSLRHVNINKNRGLSYLSHFDFLKDINLDRCYNLVEIEGSRIKNVDISTCPKLKRIINKSTIEKMSMYNCELFQLEKTYPSLTSLELKSCDSIESISHLGNLKYLSITNCSSLRIVHMIKKIKILEIRDCKKLIGIKVINNITSCNIVNCINLTQIQDINYIHNLSIVLCSIKYLWNVNFINLTLKYCAYITHLILSKDTSIITLEECPVLNEIKMNNTIKLVSISNCYELEKLSPLSTTVDIIQAHFKLCIHGNVNPNFLKTQQLNINITNFMLHNNNTIKNILGTWGNLRYIKELQLINCEAIFSIYDIPSLSKLIIKNCENLDNIKLIPNIEYLEIINCNNLYQIESHTCGIKILTITNCNQLNMVCFLSNIQVINIDRKSVV